MNSIHGTATRDVVALTAGLMLPLRTPNEQKIKDLVAYLVDPESPVNK
jgi:hypothetical protein